MRMGKVIKAIGAVLAVIGIYAVAAAVLPEDDRFSIELPGGAYYYYFTISGVISGSVEFEYTVSDGSIAIYAFSSEEFTTYEETGSADPLYETSGDSGSFTFSLPDSGKYYFVIEHTAFYLAWTQDIEVSTTVNGIGIFALLMGIILISGGAALTIYGMRVAKKEAAAIPPSGPAPSAVMIFQDDKRPPSNP